MHNAVEAVKQRVMIDTLAEVEELVAKNVGARLAATHYALKGSVSGIAMAAHWSGARLLAEGVAP